MIKLKPEDAAAFDAINVRGKAQTATFFDFLQQYQAMQEQLTRDGQAIWSDIKDRYHLEGDWRYEDGKLVPVPTFNPSGKDANVQLSEPDTVSVDTWRKVYHGAPLEVAERAAVDEYNKAHPDTREFNAMLGAPPSAIMEGNTSDLRRDPPVSDPDGHLRR